MRPRTPIKDIKAKLSNPKILQEQLEELIREMKERDDDVRGFVVSAQIQLEALLKKPADVAQKTPPRIEQRDSPILATFIIEETRRRPSVLSLQKPQPSAFRPTTTYGVR